MKRFTVALAIAMICLFGSKRISLAQQTHHEQKKESAIDKIKSDTLSKRGTVDTNVVASIKGIIQHYLQLKNALANDKTKDAAAAGKELVDALGTVEKSLFTAAQRKFYADIEDDAREQAEHISENANNIGHQREHFAVLSQDVYDLVKTFGAGQLLYKSFCSMYNDGKGAMWLSETKAIKNPYYGKRMLTCGSVQEEIK